MKILHADDHPLFREGIRFFLKLLDQDVVVLEASNYQMVLDRLALAPSFDLVLLDLVMPGMGELSGFFNLRRLYPDLPIAILSGGNDPKTIKALIDGGARGYIPKLASSDELMGALRKIVGGGVYIPKSLFVAGWEREADAAKESPVTPRQEAILSLVADGMSNKAIAGALGITEGTVKQHLKILFKRLAVHNRTEAARAARDLGLLSD
jgi:DNA-binding NarL/FixJ family response regulator